MRTRTLAGTIAPAVAALIMLEVAPVPVEGSGARCAAREDYDNYRRRVKGAIGVECSRPHTPPWGNWGVESLRGSRIDGFQYAGWKIKGDDPWRQWNSCTLNHKKWRAPNSEFYNDNNDTTQKADSDNIENYASHVSYGPSGTSCETLYDNVETFRNQFMTLYELDGGGIFGGADDFVTSLQFGTVHVPMECSNAWNCSGSSRWKSSSYDTKAAARIRIQINTWRH